MSDSLVERLRNWTTDWDGSKMVAGEPPKDGLHCDIIDEAADRIEALEGSIDAATHAMAETSPNWEARCHAIMAALGVDFGGYSEDVPDVGSWFEVSNRRNLIRISDLRAQLAQRDAALKAADELAKSAKKQKDRFLSYVRKPDAKKAMRSLDADDDFDAALGDYLKARGQDAD